MTKTIQAETTQKVWNDERTFEEKLISVQSELKAPKNQKNNFGNYKYRSCEDILEAVKPLLVKDTKEVYNQDMMKNILERGN